MDDRMPPEERELVQALMFRGWYRDGQEPQDSPHRGLWRFRAGHFLETPHRPTILARAPDQQMAMRAVLEWLRQKDATQAVSSLPEGQIIVEARPTDAP